MSTFAYTLITILGNATSQRRCGLSRTENIGCCLVRVWGCGYGLHNRFDNQKLGIFPYDCQITRLL